MTVQAYIIMNQQERDDATLLDDQDVGLGAYQLDNPMVNQLGHGTLLGMWVSPARLLNDPDYTRWVPTLGLLPIYILDTDTMYLPPPINP